MRPEIPPAPAAASDPCRMTPWTAEPGGAMLSWQAEAAIRSLLLDLKRCDDKRRLAVDAWPGR